VKGAYGDTRIKNQIDYGQAFAQAGCFVEIIDREEVRRLDEEKLSRPDGKGDESRNESCGGSGERRNKGCR
jgi:hypothetical protein